MFYYLVAITMISVGLQANPSCILQIIHINRVQHGVRWLICQRMYGLVIVQLQIILTLRIVEVPPEGSVEFWNSLAIVTEEVLLIIKACRR